MALSPLLSRSNDAGFDAGPGPIEFLGPKAVLLAGGDAPGVRAALDSGGQHRTILTAETFDEVLRTAQITPSVGLAILNCRLPGLDGTAGIVRLRMVRPELPIIVLYQGSCCERDNAIALLRAGAAGVVPDTMAEPAMAGALCIVLGGEKFAPPEMLVSLGAEAGDARLALRLSPREAEVAALLATGLSNKEIALRLGLREVTIKVYAAALFRKLGVRNRTEATRRLLAIGFG